MADKFKLLREIEGDLSQRQFGELVGIPQGTIANIEKGRNKSTSAEVLAKIVRHPRFFPYAMWLLVDELTEEQAADTLRYLNSLQENNE